MTPKSDKNTMRPVEESPAISPAKAKAAFDRAVHDLRAVDQAIRTETDKRKLPALEEKRAKAEQKAREAKQAWDAAVAANKK